jgi:hypothetical protein
MRRPGVDSPASEIPYHPNLTVNLRKGETKSRNIFYVAGLGDNKKFLAFNNTTLGMARALNERLFYFKEDGVWKESLVPASVTVRQKLREFTSMFDRFASFTVPLDYPTFVGKYQGRKRLRYLNAALELNRRGLQPSDSHVKFFLKVETYNFTVKPNSCPRGINPRSDECLVWTGCYISVIEKKMYSNVEKMFGYKVVMKGLNQRERGEIISSHWAEFDDPVCILVDASTFEQSVTVPFLEWETERYCKYFPGDKAFREVMKRQQLNIGKAVCKDGWISFKKLGGRMSGDNNTALGNCMISVAMCYSVCLELGINFYRVFLDGDDVGFIFERAMAMTFQARARQWYKELGFRMKIEKSVYELEHIDFCQSRPVWTESGYLMVRNPHTSLSKYATCKTNLTSVKDWLGWAAAVGQGGLAVAGGIPVLQNYYRSLVRASKGARPMIGAIDEWTLENKYRGMNREFQEVHYKSRASFWAAFGVTPDEQISVERYYDALSLEYGLDEAVLMVNPVLPGFTDLR